MVRELLRRSLAVISSATVAENRLSSLETRLTNLEQGQTEHMTSIHRRVGDVEARVDEWAGVEGYSEHHE